MDDLPAKHPGPFNQKITLSRKILDVYLKLLLLLLENVKHSQSLSQCCPTTTEVEAFPKFTSEAGTPFFFKLPISGTAGQMQHYQVSLADGDSALPHWMVFRRQTCSLAGLALAEDCGIYRLKVSVIGEQCAVCFYLHILNRTVADKDPARKILSCPEGEMTLWANLLLQLSPLTLNASQRIHLVSTMADYLHLPLGFVYLFSRRKSFIQQQEKLRLCRQGGLAEKITRGNEKQDALGDVAELLWPVGCQGEERQNDLAKVLEYSVKAGGVARLLEAPVLGWRVLCAPGVVRHKVKRDFQRLKSTPTPNWIFPLPTQIHQTVKLKHSHIYSFPFTKLEPSLSTILLHMNHHGEIKLEPTPAEDSMENAAISVIKQFLPSGAQVDTWPDSDKFNHTGNAFTTLIYHSDTLEMPVTVLKSHMQKIQVSSNSLSSVKQPTLYTCSKDVNTILEWQVFTARIILTTLHTSVCVEFGCINPNWFSVHNSQKHIKQAGLSVSISKVTSDTSLSISEFPLPFLPEHMYVVSTVVGEPSADTALSLLPSSTLHSVYPSLSLTPASYSVTSTLTHEAVDRKLLATRLTLQPHPKETPLQTGAYRSSHTDSESQPTVSSLGHIIYNQGPFKDHHAAKLTHHNLPSVPHPPLTENYNDILPLDSRLKTIQSQPPSNKIPSTQLFPDVSPTSYLMTEQLSITQHFDTIQHLSSALNQDVMSQLNGTTQDASSTRVTGQLTLSGQTELEPSLSASTLEPSVTTFTPALPSELGFFSGQLETPNIINPVFTAESLKASSSTMPPLQTFSKSLLSDIGVSSLQKNLESPVVTELQSKSITQLHFDQHALMQTLSSDILLASLQPTYPSWALQMSLLSMTTHHITSFPLSMFKDQPFKERPSVKSAHESMQFMPLMQQTLRTLLLGEFSHVSLVTGVTASMHLNTAVLTIIAPSPNMTYPVPLSIYESTRLVSGDHFNPTAPSTVQQPYTTSFIHQIQNLDPSFPLCGQSVAQDHANVNGCTPQIKSTYLESTVEHVLDFMTSYSQDEKHRTAFQSLFLKFDSATRQLKISDALPSLDGSGFSVITYTSLASNTSALSVSTENSLFFSQTDSNGPVTKGRPTQQILSMSLSQFYEMSTTLLTSLQAVGLSSYRRQSSVQPTPPSTPISSSMNLPPKVLQSIPVLMATVGFPFHYSIPPKTFLDPEDGEADALSLEIRLIDGPPISVGTWLALDGLELHGIPLEVDLQFAPQHLLLAAWDGQGLSTWLPLTVDLRRSLVRPCHVFTLTAQRSLHSILRHRHRVELLLRKLSRFFNDSSNHHLSVISMRSGSTVVSWYNYSLCRMSHDRLRQCHVGQIRSMWLAMRSADGSVKSAFREAMLPEFPITKVGPVSYRLDCFSTTTPIFAGSTPAVHTTPTLGLGTNTSFSPTSNTCVSVSPAVTAASQQTNHYQWMAGMFTALLVVCLLILIVLVVVTVLHFCKSRGRSRTVAIWPASGVLSLQSRDLRAIRPRRPPLFQPELPPPPLRLWINPTQDDKGQPPSKSERGRKTLDKALQPRPPQYDFSSI